MVQDASTHVLENLTRLASKPGVQSTLILSKSDGSIIRSTGLLATSTKKPSSDAPINGTVLDQEMDHPSAAPSTHENTSGKQGEGEDGGKSAEKIARMVFAFLAAANDFVDGVEKGEDIKLLRMRIRKNEIVIVPVIIKVGTAPQLADYSVVGSRKKMQ
ncbi:MAG: hypothetical protein L6R35_000910 [Caloplaca aegaea]|nr:MAG: hypothetical protein L6R35_000910 [Caloplaca aegaea]